MKQLRFTLLIVLVCSLLSCHEGVTLPPDHPEYFDRVYRQVDSLNLSPERSFAFLDSIYRNFPNPGILDQARRFDYKGQYYFYEARDWKNSLLYVDSTLQLLSEPEVRKKYPRQYARALLNKGEVYQFQKNRESSLFYYYKGRKAIDQVKDSCTMADYTQRLAMASYRAGRYADARAFFEQADREFATCSLDFRSFAFVQSDLDNTGMCYAQMGKWDSAALYYDSTLRYLDRTEHLFSADSLHHAYIETAKAVVEGNKADYFLAKGDTALALAQFAANINTNLRPRHDSGNALTSLAKLAGLHLARNHFDKAQQTLDTMRTVLARRPYPEMELARRKLQAEWYQRKGAGLQAYASLNDWRRLRDSLDHLEEPLSAINFPSELQHMEDQYTIQLLEQKDRLKTGYLVLTGIVVALLLALLIMIIRDDRRSKRYIRELNRLNLALKTENHQTQLAIHSLNESQAGYMQSLKTVAHDLRNPITAISSALTLIDHNPTTDEKSRSSLLALIRQATDQSLALLGNILQLDIPVGKLKKEPVDLARLLQTCTGTMQFKATGKGQTLRLEAEPMELHLDQEKIWRVVINLLDNAIRFSPEGADICLSAVREKGEARISVSDQGIAGESSSGHGLALAKRFVQAHGGTLHVRSKEQQGTTFTIALPL